MVTAWTPLNGISRPECLLHPVVPDKRSVGVPAPPRAPFGRQARRRAAQTRTSGARQQRSKPRSTTKTIAAPRRRHTNDGTRQAVGARPEPASDAAMHISPGERPACSPLTGKTTARHRATPSRSSGSDCGIPAPSFRSPSIRQQVVVSGSGNSTAGSTTLTASVDGCECCALCPNSHPVTASSWPAPHRSGSAVPDAVSISPWRQPRTGTSKKICPASDRTVN